MTGKGEPWHTKEEEEEEEEEKCVPCREYGKPNRFVLSALQTYLHQKRKTSNQQATNSNCRGKTTQAFIYLFIHFPHNISSKQKLLIKITKCLKHDHTQFVCNALRVWKPMQIHQGRCNVIKTLQAKNQTSSRIQHRL